MASPGIDSRLETEFAEIAATSGCELVHAAFAAGRLCVILDHPEGVTLEHCQSFSKQVSALLDVQDYGPNQYLLEVSSPGLDRQLFRKKDYRRFIDSKVRVRFLDAASRKKRTIVGILESFSDDAGGRIVVVDNDSGETMVIALQRIEVARLEIDL